MGLWFCQSKLLLVSRCDLTTEWGRCGVRLSLRGAGRGAPYIKSLGTQRAQRTAAEEDAERSQLFPGGGQDDGGAEFDGAVFFVPANCGVDFGVDSGPRFGGDTV